MLNVEAGLVRGYEWPARRCRRSCRAKVRHNHYWAKIITMRWTRWRAFPDPTKGQYLNAPFGPGVYELRNVKANRKVLFGKGKHVARRLTSILPAPVGGGTRNNTGKRQYVLAHLSDIQYRTLACPTPEAATAEENKLRANRAEYIYPT